MLHHDLEESDDDLGAGSQENLSFASLLSIVDALQSVCENVHSHHFAGLLSIKEKEVLTNWSCKKINPRWTKTIIYLCQQGKW